MEIAKTLQRPQNQKIEKMYQEAIAAHQESKPSMSLVVVGHVDAGKSTLMGRVLWELGQVHTHPTGERILGAWWFRSPSS